MQAWRAPVRRCLFSVYRPLAYVPYRPFVSTSPLERSKPKNKKKSKKALDLGLSKDKNKESMRRRERVEISKSDEFADILENAFGDLKHQLRGDKDKLKSLEDFRETVVDAFDGSNDFRHRRLKNDLRQRYIDNGPGAVHSILKRGLEHDIYDREYMSSIDVQERLADLSTPAEWYPAARAIQRRIHLHVGPTNSGKTYHALKRLEQAETGFYAGPLRLLAHEVYTRLNNKGIPCGLVTGDEVKIDEEIPPRIYSNTVEMAPLGKELEVGVIDEIQMIADENRGWAWTRALLGSQVHELHLCGEERVVPLITELVALTGDKLEIHRYQRLNPLKTMTTSLKGSLKKLQKGDCIVAFSRLTIHALKREIERETGRRAAIVYGGLPAEIRAQQAELFNDPDNDYDFLVASDAIGMGLNLACKRIIFESVVRKLPTGLTRLTVSEVKQIGGRAGRYRSALQTNDKDGDSSNVGFVTSLEDIDLPYIREALKSNPEPIRQAGLLPPDHMIQQFAEHFPPEVSFSYLLQRLGDLAQTDRRFFLCIKQGQDKIAAVLDRIKNLNVLDKLCFLKAPLSSGDEESQTIISAFASCVANNKSGALLSLPEMKLDVLDEPVSGNKEYLRALEYLHRSLVLYLWLSFRCGGIFTDRTLATHVKELVEIKMDRALTEFSANSKLQKASSLRRQIALLQQMHAEMGTPSPFTPTDEHLDLELDESELEEDEAEESGAKKKVSSG